jgi:hypothetical protein
MPIFAVVSNGLLVYAGNCYMMAQCIYTKQAKPGRMVILYQNGMVRMQTG